MAAASSVGAATVMDDYDRRPFRPSILAPAGWAGFGKLRTANGGIPVSALISVVLTATVLANTGVGCVPMPCRIL
jgi:hypothetical protein